MTDGVLMSPLVPVFMTIAVYWAARHLSDRSRGHPLCNPVLVSICVITLLLTVTGMPYDQYIRGAQIINFVLGPAVVGLAVPLYNNLNQVGAAPFAVSLGVAVGSLSGAVFVIFAARLLEADPHTIASMVPKSVTSPVAMEIAKEIGGIPSLAAVFAVLTGLIGASIGPAVLDLLGIRDADARGLALGTTSTGIGTARALQESERAGAFAGLAMGTAALGMSVVVPILWR